MRSCYQPHKGYAGGHKALQASLIYWIGGLIASLEVTLSYAFWASSPQELLPRRMHLHPSCWHFPNSADRHSLPNRIKREVTVKWKAANLPHFPVHTLLPAQHWTAMITWSGKYICLLSNLSFIVKFCLLHIASVTAPEVHLVWSECPVLSGKPSIKVSFISLANTR